MPAHRHTKPLNSIPLLLLLLFVVKKACTYYMSQAFFGRFDENSGPKKTQVFTQTQVKFAVKLRFSAIFSWNRSLNWQKFPKFTLFGPENSGLSWKNSGPKFQNSGFPESAHQIKARKPSKKKPGLYNRQWFSWMLLSISQEVRLRPVHSTRPSIY